MILNMYMKIKGINNVEIEPRLIVTLRISIPRFALPNPPPHTLYLKCDEITIELKLSSISANTAIYTVPQYAHEIMLSDQVICTVVQ